jgi:phosphoenolpyruvate carboxykinase (GTP)
MHRLDRPTLDAGIQGDRAAAHPNSRFTAPMTNNPALDSAANDPEGVPVSAIIFGGRRSNTMPLVYQAFNWMHGVYVGATLGSETTAAATGSSRRGPPRSDGHASVHWLQHPRLPRPLVPHAQEDERLPAHLPRQLVPQGRKGKFIWPGFGENMRVLKWIIDRCHGRAYAVETPLGWMPREEDIDLKA